MRVLCTLLPAALTLPLLVPAGLASDDKSQSSALNARDELLKLETRWNEAHLRGDADGLKQLWADELVVTVQEMPVMDKSQALKIVASGRVKFKQYETSDIKVNVFGDAAVVTGRVKRVRERSGKDVEDDWRFTKVYVRRDGAWQVVAWHGSQTAK
jgi:ketosteroid isomerase-like protein